MCGIFGVVAGSRAKLDDDKLIKISKSLFLLSEVMNLVRNEKMCIVLINVRLYYNLRCCNKRCKLKTQTGSGNQL